MKKIKKIKKKSKKRKRHWEKFQIPTKNIEVIARSLKKKIYLHERESKYAPVKEVLTLLAGGVFLAASVVMPGLSHGLKAKGMI